jgi:hypothetical protein
MTTTSEDFWLTRLSDALEKAVAAPSERTRIAYLELARHYCSMHQRSNRRNVRPVAGHPDPVFLANAEFERHDFRSVHDALMQAA